MNPGVGITLKQDEAKGQIQAPNIQFLRPLSGAIDEVVPEPVDRVLVNSAFWQFRLDAVLNATAKVLKPEGDLDFNLPNSFYDFPKGVVSMPQVMSISMLMMTESILPGLTYEQRIQVLDKAYAQLDKSVNFPQYWIYYRATKK